MRVKWQSIPGLERQYEVSNTGLIRRVNIRLLKSEISNTGYSRTTVFLGNKKWKHISIHRAVAQTFIPNPDHKPFVNHKNGIRNDNRLENLEWVTTKENSQHAVDTGLYPIGIRNGKAKLTEAQVRTIRNMYQEGISVNSLAKKYRMDESTLFDLVKYRTWKHVA